MCAKDARSRDCSVPENPGVNSSTLGMPGLDCSVQWILGVCNGYLVCAKDARSRDCSVPENPGVNSSTLGMSGLDCSVQWILGVC